MDNTIYHEKRDCEVRKLDFQECKPFLDRNHLQGAGVSTSINYGLFLRSTNELVGVATFGRVRFEESVGYPYEWYRLAYKRGVEVRGGTDRLLKCFEKEVVEKDSLVSYQFDNFKGGMFPVLGFEKISSSSVTLRRNPQTGKTTTHRFRNDKRDRKLQDWLLTNSDRFSSISEAMNSYYGYTEIIHNNLACIKWVKSYKKGMAGYIYCITSPEGKRYVGQKRKNYFDPSYWSSSMNPEFWDDLRAYGKKAFKREILEWCDTPRDLNDREIFWIDEMKSMYSQGGYNVARSVHQIEWTEENTGRRLQKLRDYWNDGDHRKQRGDIIKNSEKYKESRKWVGDLITAGIIESNKNNPERYMFAQTDSFKEKQRIKTQGKKFYNNGTVQVLSDECPEGFVKGFIPHEGSFKIGNVISEELKQKNRETQKTLIWVNNGESNKRIKLGSEIPRGFSRGRFFPKGEYLWYNNGTVETKSKLPIEGYGLGRLPRNSMPVTKLSI